MKLGILGTGMIAKEFLSISGQLNIESMAVYGRNKDAIYALAAQYSIAAFSDCDALLHSDIDTVYVALPNALHYAFGRKALEAGKHVILEKPAAASFAQFQELAVLAKQRDLLLFEAVTTHYLPAYRSLREELAGLGRIRIVSLNYSQYSSRYDRFKAGEILPAFDPKQAGGALMDLNVYNLHFVVGLFGAPSERAIDTSGIMALDYGDFKAVCIGAKDCQAPIQSTIQGDGGNLVVTMPANQMTAYERSGNDGNRVQRSFDDGSHRMVYEFRAFDRMIREHDVKTCEEMLERSGIVARILEEGRKQAGIVFPSDR